MENQIAEVKILVTGYLSNESGGQTCPTISLIRDNQNKIIIDPGTASKPELIFEALKKENLTPEEINYVFLTHSHYDHFKNITLFPKAKCRDYWGLWDNAYNTEATENFSSNISVINTPGHSYDSLTFLVKTAEGVVAICGDLFFKENFPAHDPHCQNEEVWISSRKKVNAAADLIIPGHGAIFKALK